MFRGVWLREQLYWTTYVSKLSSALSRSVGIIHKLGFLLPTWFKWQLYYALVHSHFHYCSLVWGMRTKSNLSGPETKQFDPSSVSVILVAHLSRTLQILVTDIERKRATEEGKKNADDRLGVFFLLQRLEIVGTFVLFISFYTVHEAGVFHKVQSR